MATEKKTDPHAPKLAELQKQYGRVAHVVVSGKLLAFRPPTLDEFEAMHEALDKRPKGMVYRETANLLSVTLNDEELAEIFETYPVLPARISDAIAALAGANLELTVKKD